MSGRQFLRPIAAPPRRTAAVWALPLLLSVAACSAGTPAARYADDPATKSLCAELYADAPETVAGQQRRSVTDDRALAWDTIMMHCGVKAPAGLNRTSRCDFVSAVGWFTKKDGDYYTFTTIGRKAFVSVVVPKSYEPPADVLIDVAAVIKEHNPVVTPCV